jgi:UDP-N-acetylglucosamine 2-epimerase (non-hydrolysing)
MTSHSKPSEIKILTVVGARPNFMKVAPIIRAISESNQKADGPRIQHVLVHTGQHYDAIMSDRFFVDLGLPKPDVHLGVGSGSHAHLTADVMQKFEPVLLAERPDFVLVVGDVNSTVACALVAAKIAFDAAGTRPLICHVESGLRSFDRLMPEEVNRVVTDHVSDLLFVTEESGLQNLRREGIPAEKIHFVGNTMIDSLLEFSEKAEESKVLEELGFRVAAKNGAAPPVSKYALLTLHRPSNVDTREAFLKILAGLDELASDRPIVFPVHPRTQQRIKELGSALPLPMSSRGFAKEEARAGDSKAGLLLIDPLGYLDFLCLMKHASIVVTDSGGIQEETTCLGIPCVTVRENTERPVTVDKGTNIIAGTTTEGIRQAIRRQAGVRGTGAPKNWDGRAAKRIVETLVQVSSPRDSSEAHRALQPHSSK